MGRLQIRANSFGEVIWFHGAIVFIPAI
jgi:hypothetical protein